MSNIGSSGGVRLGSSLMSSARLSGELNHSMTSRHTDDLSSTEDVVEEEVIMTRSDGDRGMSNNSGGSNGGLGSFSDYDECDVDDDDMPDDDCYVQPDGYNGTASVRMIQERCNFLRGSEMTLGPMAEPLSLVVERQRDMSPGSDLPRTCFVSVQHQQQPLLQRPNNVVEDDDDSFYLEERPTRNADSAPPSFAGT
jgi:hypothetical protein